MSTTENKNINQLSPAQSLKTLDSIMSYNWSNIKNISICSLPSKYCLQNEYMLVTGTGKRTTKYESNYCIK